MRVPRIKTSFVWVVLVCGLLSLAFIIGNLSVLGLQRYPASPYLYVNGGDIRRGKELVVRKACGSCHVIPGIHGASGRVGPSLADLVEQTYIAGVLVNSPENLVRWMRDPRSFSPHTAMPDMGLSEQDAKDIAAFLYRHAGHGGR